MKRYLKKAKAILMFTIQIANLQRTAKFLSVTLFKTDYIELVENFLPKDKDLHLIYSN